MSPRITPLSLVCAVLGVAVHATSQTAAPDWTLLTTTNAPASRIDHGLCYFETPDGIGRVLMQGGTVGANATTETWLLNTLTGAWQQVTTAAAPPARWNLVSAFDRTRQRAVVFGGQFGGTYRSDTWEFDGTNWTQMTPSTVPSGRRFHAMAFDSARGVVVMFGGQNSIGTLLNDTWEWNGSNWTQRNPGSSPGARTQHAMCFDSVRGVTVMSGGSPSPTNETWEWNGTNWSQKANMPAGDFGHAMVYDAARQRSVMLQSIFGTPNTYEWNGTSWTQITTTANMPPIGSFGQLMAYDEGRGVSVYVNGGTTTIDTHHYGSPTPASFFGFGSGCTGTGGYLPRLRGQTAIELPWINTTLDVVGIAAPSGGQTVFMNVGVSDTVIGGLPLPLDLTPLGAPGCFAWVSNEATVSGTTNSVGVITFQVVVPNNAGLVGTVLFFQLGVFDATANSLGIVTSAGRRAIVGT